VNADKLNFVSFLVFVGADASFTAKISSFETVAKRKAILNVNPVPKQCIFNNYSPKAKLILLNNPRDEVEEIIQQY